MWVAIVEAIERSNNFAFEAEHGLDRHFEYRTHIIDWLDIERVVDGHEHRICIEPDGHELVLAGKRQRDLTHQHRIELAVGQRLPEGDAQLLTLRL